MVDRIVEVMGNEADSLLKHQCRFGKTRKKVCSELTSSHPIDLTRRQVVNCRWRAGLINSGGAWGENDLAPAVRTATINKTCRRYGAYFPARGVPAPDAGGRGVASCHPGRVS